MESMKRIAPPKEIPKDEWTKSELKRGETFPEYIKPIASRVNTPEKRQEFADLTAETRRIQEELFMRWPEPWDLNREQLNELVMRYEVELINIASRARAFADSHRKFNVGGVVIGYRDPRVSDGTRMRYPNDLRLNPWRIMFDANTRPDTVQGDVRKHCAELYLSDRIDKTKPEFGTREEKLGKAVALLVVGEAQVDNDSEIRQITLTCCKLCRDRLWKMTKNGNGRTAIYSADMPVISADARNLHLRKWQPVSRLHEFHRELPPGHQEID